MAAIRSKNTKPELQLRRELRARGLTGYRVNLKTLPGKPDIAFTRWKVALFVDGAFWHGHPGHYEFGRPGRADYWDPKIRRTQERDRAADKALAEAGWSVSRFWDFEVLGDPGRCAEAVEQVLAARSGGRAADR